MKTKTFLLRFRESECLLEYFICEISGLGKIIRYKLTPFKINKLNPSIFPAKFYNVQYLCGKEEPVKLNSFYTSPLANFKFTDDNTYQNSEIGSVLL